MESKGRGCGSLHLFSSEGLELVFSKIHPIDDKSVDLTSCSEEVDWRNSCPQEELDGREVCGAWWDHCWFVLQEFLLLQQVLGFSFERFWEWSWVPVEKNGS